MALKFGEKPPKKSKEERKEEIKALQKDRARKRAVSRPIVRLFSATPTRIQCKRCGAISGPDTIERFSAFIFPHMKLCGKSSDILITDVVRWIEDPDFKGEVSSPVSVGEKEK